MAAGADHRGSRVLDLRHSFASRALALGEGLPTKLQTRRWRKEGEDSDRFSTEILLVPGSRIQFLDKPKDDAPAQADPATTGNGKGMTHRVISTEQSQQRNHVSLV